MVKGHFPQYYAHSKITEVSPSHEFRSRSLHAGLSVSVARQPKLGPRPPYRWGSHTTHTIRHTRTRGRTPLNTWLAHRRGRYLHYIQTQEKKSLATAEFEPAIPAIERPQVYTFDRTATHLGSYRPTDPNTPPPVPTPKSPCFFTKWPI